MKDEKHYFYRKFIYLIFLEIEKMMILSNDYCNFKKKEYNNNIIKMRCRDGLVTTGSERKEELIQNYSN